MRQQINLPISVSLQFNHNNHQVFPYRLTFKGRTYTITKIGLHHTFRQGRTLFHIFSVVSQNFFFRLKLNTDNLFWTLEEVSDGLPE